VVPIEGGETDICVATQGCMAGGWGQTKRQEIGADDLPLSKPPLPELLWETKAGATRCLLQKICFLFHSRLTQL
jgi:hypothetical protein